MLFRSLYLRGEITRAELYHNVPDELIKSVINLPIGSGNNDTIFGLISQQLNGEKVDLIIGGPPCQAYSVVGRARSADGMRNDPRNFLYIQYATFLEKYQPRFFLFENVLGLKSAKDGDYLKRMEDLFGYKGYKMQLYILAANNFGVLQNRKRIIIFGYRKDILAKLPDLEAYRVSHNFKVGNIFCDLPAIKAGCGKDKYDSYISEANDYLSMVSIRNGSDILTQHIARPQSEQDKRIYRIAVRKWNNEKQRLAYNDLPEDLKSHKNRHSFFDRFKVVAEDLAYSQTVVAHIAKDGHYYIDRKSVV